MNKKNFNLNSMTLLLVLLMGSLSIYAQGTKGLPADPDFHYYIANESRTSANQIEFDLLLLNTNPSLVFELGSVQAGILINPAIYNGGVVTASVVKGSSTLNPSQVPGVITFVQRKNCIKIAPKSPPGIGSGTIVSSDPSNPTKVCRVRLTNTQSWASGNTDLRFNFTSKPYPTKISRYVAETGLNTPMQVNPYTAVSQQAVEKDDIPTMNQLGKTDRIMIHPNPNNGQFTLTVTSDIKSSYELSIINNLGVNVYKQNDFVVDGSRKEELSLKNLSNGSYTLQLINSHEQLTGKFIIKH